MLDIYSFFIIIAFSFFVIAITNPGTSDLFMIIGFFFLIVPTVVALISGAPFVPTPMDAVKKLLKAAGIKKGEKVIDIGCGDGRMVHLAAKEHHAQATGYELSPLVYALAKIRQFFWRSKAKVVFGDFRMHDLSKVDHIVCYMLPDTLKKYIPKFEKELRKGARITSYAFSIGDWKPVKVVPKDAEKNISQILVYEIGKH